MFIGFDQEGTRINSLIEDEGTLRQKVKNNEIACPDCGAKVGFRSGTFRPHFYHRNSVCTNHYGEPESETHLTGKVQLYYWLSRLFPEAKVEMEWKVAETQQRSDIMVLHKNGERWAFEFQCSPISEGVWNERHMLYREANVYDVWVLHSEMNKSINDSNKSFRLSRGIERAVYRDNRRIHYLDVDRERFHVIRGGEFDTKTKLSYTAEFYDLSMNKSRLIGLDIWNRKMLRYYMNDEHLDELMNNEPLFEYVLNEIAKVQKRKETVIKKNQNRYYLMLQHGRNQEFVYLSQTEKILLNELLLKHHYTIETMPGFFFGNWPSVGLDTPIFLIQLWLYDQIVFDKSRYPSKQGFPTIWAPNCLKSITQLKKKRAYRVQKSNIKGIYISQDKVLVDGILDYWCNIGFIEKLGRSGSFYYRILCDRIPPHSSLKESIFIEWYFSGDKRVVPMPAEVEKVGRDYRMSYKKMSDRYRAFSPNNQWGV